MFIKSSLRGQKVHKSMNFVHDLATLCRDVPTGSKYLTVIKFNDGTSGFKNLLGFVLRCAI